MSTKSGPTLNNYFGAKVKNEDKVKTENKVKTEDMVKIEGKVRAQERPWGATCITW